MKTIALVSDNHGYDGKDMWKYLEDCDEIWHAGDIGSLESLDRLKEYAPVRAVYGNIDGKEIRAEYNLNEFWECEGMSIFMTHIGGYPGRYKKRAHDLIKEHKPDIYICGHSHICKVMRDKRLDVIHMNPGSYGHRGFHKIRTMLKFNIADSQIGDLSVIELGFRGRLGDKS